MGAVAGIRKDPKTQSGSAIGIGFSVLSTLRLRVLRVRRAGLGKSLWKSQSFRHAARPMVNWKNKSRIIWHMIMIRVIGNSIGSVMCRMCRLGVKWTHLIW